jgi:sugar phosphate isomerase/epimerase
MHLGIKVGLENWRAKLDNDLDIRAVEVHFDLTRLDAYEPLFGWLRDRGVAAGLHASTALDGGVLTNLVSEDQAVRQASIALTRRTLDVAAAHGMRFVILHPGSYLNWGIWQGRCFTVGKPVSPEAGNRRVVDEVVRLAAYGRQRGVDLWAENLPGRDYASYEPIDREQTLDVGFPPHTVLRQVGEHGVGLCVDVGHAYAEAMAHSPGVDCFAEMVEATRVLVPYACHLHLSTIVPPWNGTDSHNGFLPEDYAQGAVPTREQLLAWLRLFDGRDLWVIPEPYGGPDVHLANYGLLQAWMEQLD